MNDECRLLIDDPMAVTQFVRKGYAHFRGAYDAALMRESREFVMDRYEWFSKRAQKLKDEPDVNGWAVAIMQQFEKTRLYEEMIGNGDVQAMLKQFTGPDLAILGFDALWINVPKDKDPVLLKGIHSDAWTGTSTNTVFAKVFFTDCDKWNGMSVCPGSHLQGMVPVRNRAVDPRSGVKWKAQPVKGVQAGDLLIWHPLLLHSTTGHSGKNIRISMTSRYISTETPRSSQERALGYRTLSVGPMNQVLRLVGNDYLTPHRTVGGFVGVDRRMSSIYDYSEYRGHDYSGVLAGRNGK